MRVLFLVLLFFPSSHLSAQDYTIYHKAIIKAEEQLFVEKKIKEGLNTYANVFSKYDFVFLHDCLTAMQMALYANDEESFMQFTVKAMENGLKLTNLAKFSYITKHPFYIKNKDSISVVYRRNRPHYLRRLDTSTLTKIYEMYGTDQAEKNPRKGESPTDHSKRYGPLIKARMADIRKIVEDRGFPSDKLIGIGQNNIMTELHLGKPELLNYYNEFKNDFNINKEQFEMQEYESSSASLILPILIHYQHRFGRPFDDDLYLAEIKRGDLHPKDFAHLNDDIVERPVGGHFRVPDLTKGEMYFRVGLRGDELGSAESASEIPDAEINKFRARFFIAPIENDRARRKFMKEQGMFCNWGFTGSRS